MQRWKQLPERCLWIIRLMNPVILFLETLWNNIRIASADIQTVNHHLKDQIGESLGSLTQMEEKVLRLRFGLDDDDPLTLKEIGDQNEFVA